MSSPSIKDTHESEACKRFLSIYNFEHRQALAFVRQGDANKNEPDCICADGLGIELVGVYDNSYQAERIWGEARGKETKRQKDIVLLTFENLENEIVKS